MVLIPRGAHMRPNPTGVSIKSCRGWPARANLLVLWPPRPSVLGKFPRLLKPPPTLLEWPASSFGLSLAFRGHFRISLWVWSPHSLPSEQPPPSQALGSHLISRPQLKQTPPLPVSEAQGPGTHFLSRKKPSALVSLVERI